MKIASNDIVSLRGCCKISARRGTLVIGCVGAFANLVWMLSTILAQKSRIFKASTEEPTGMFTDQIFGTLIAFSVVGALLGILLIISVIGRKGVLKILAYPWIPINAIILLTTFILQFLAWDEKIHYWNDYYEKIYRQPNELGEIITTVSIIGAIIGAIFVAIWFSILSLFVWTFIKTDYKDSTDPDQS